MTESIDPLLNGQSTAPVTEIVEVDVVDPEVAGDGAGGGGDDDDTAEQSPAHRHRALLDWAVVIIVALLVAFVVRTFVLAHFVVDGTSMFSTLHDDDRVFVNKLSYRLHDPNRGDVVVLHQSAGASERDLIKRVIALPGETIEIRNCQVSIDGRALEEPYLDPEVVTPGNCGGDLAPTDVPEDHVFVMGDNRGGSQDSRALGPIDEDDLVGRAFIVFWPQSHWQWL
jgi:signal peptidase I